MCYRAAWIGSVLLLSVPTAGCRTLTEQRNAAPLSPGTAERIRSEVRALLQRQVDAWNQGDVDGFMAGYWNDPNLTFLSDANVITGWAPTRDRYRRRYPDRRAMGRLTFSDLHIRPLSPRAALTWGRWRLERADAIGGLFTLILEKHGDGWVIVHDHTTVASP